MKSLPIPTSWLEADPATLRGRVVPAGALVLLRTETGRPVCLLVATEAVQGSSLIELCGIGSLASVLPGVEVLDRANRELPVTDVTPGNRPSMTVVIPTLGDEGDLNRLLPSLVAESEWVDQVIVVPNGCDPQPVRELVHRLLAPGYDGAVQVIPSGIGSSRARNVGLAAAHGELCAFLDADVLIEPGWGRAAAAAAVRHPDAALITGMVLGSPPATEAQFWFESVGGFRKGLDEVRTDGGGLSETDALIRVASLGTGANVIGRTSALLAIGGYCEALGLGTKAMGGEDLNLLLDVLSAGGSIVYAPQMVVRHPAPADWDQLENQAMRYGQGLTALATHRVMSGRISVRDLFAAVPKAISAVAQRDGYAGASSLAFPRKMRALEAGGLLAGPWAYLRTPRTTRRPVFVGGVQPVPLAHG